MTGQQPDIQWYIARDGKQHGPLSEVEMRTFVAQGHLKPTDLIWRPGFADWRPAPAVFPFQAPEPQTAAPRPQTGRRPEPARGPAAAPERSFEPNRIRVAQGSRDSRSSGGRRTLGIVLLLVILGGAGGWYAWHSGGLDFIRAKMAGGSDSEQVPVVSAPDAAKTAQAPAAPVVPAVSQEAVDAGARQLDAKIEKLPVWTVVKREFPDWYGEQLREAAKLSAEKQPETAVTKHLAEALVALRRQHANEALAASTDRLKQVANAFLNNLKALSDRSVGACYGFISQGETSPAVLEVLQSPEQGASVQAQVAAIFEAIADGRKTPKAHDKAGKADYDVLVAELTKLGWKENDLQGFSNPTLLAREPPARVCQMVQDWFIAHLAVADHGTQERLLVETPKPVVSG